VTEYHEKYGQVWRLTGILADIRYFRTSERRIVLSRGDYIEHSGGIAQIKDICVHEHTSLQPPGRRLFALVRPIRFTDERDELLDLPIVESYGSDMLIGLPAISAKKLYIVDIGDVDECLVLVDWEIQFL